MKRIMILLALLALVAAGCAEQAASPSESATESAPATSEASPSDEPSEEPSESEEASAGAIPSVDLNGDPELAARFPDAVGGVDLEVQSFRGDTFAQLGGSDPAFEAFLEAIDAELSDVSVAFGGAASSTEASSLSVGAFRVVGANEDDLEREFLAASQAEGDVSGMEEATIGGKDVWTAEDPSGETDASVVVYTKDDTVYFLTGSEEQIAEILEALP